MKNPFQWEHPKAMAYNDTIRQRIIGYEYIFTLMADLLPLVAPSAKRVTVVGAGGGQELVTLLSLLPEAHFTAIDPSRNMLTLAKSRVVAAQLEGHIQYEVGELSTTARPAADIVTCHLVLHFLKERTQKEALVSAIAAHVKVGGHVFFSSINGELTDPAFKQQLAAWAQFAYRQGVKPHQWAAFVESFGQALIPISSQALEQLFERCGLTIVHQYYKAYGIEAYCLERVR